MNVTLQGNNYLLPQGDGLQGSTKGAGGSCSENGKCTVRMLSDFYTMNMHSGNDLLGISLHWTNGSPVRCGGHLHMAR